MPSGKMTDQNGSPKRGQIDYLQAQYPGDQDRSVEASVKARQYRVDCGELCESTRL